MAGRTVRLFLVDGAPTGIRTAEIGLSTIKAVIAPRSSLNELGRRAETSRTGVYILVGDDPTTPGRLQVYIGEGDSVFARLRSHGSDEAKDFWDRVVFFVSKDENLTKAHVRYLESRLVSLAKEAKRASVANGNAPTGGAPLPEPEAADMEEFLEQARLLLGTLGIPVFEPAAKQVERLPLEAGNSEPEVLFEAQGDGYQARLVIRNGEFVVLQGSRARKKEAPSLYPGVKARRGELLTNGVLLDSDDVLQFQQDFPFSSPSAAAGVVTGSTVNGRTAWCLPDGRTLKAWEDARVAAVATELEEIEELGHSASQ